MNNKQEAMYNALEVLSGETVANLFCDYHGTQLLDDGFYEFLQHEGYIAEYDEDDFEELSVDEAESWDEVCSSHQNCLTCPLRRSTFTFHSGDRPEGMTCEDFFYKLKGIERNDENED